MEAGLSVHAVKGNLGHSLNERYRESEGAEGEIYQTLPVWPIPHLTKAEVQGYAITPVRLIEMLGCKTCSSLLSVCYQSLDRNEPRYVNRTVAIKEIVEYEARSHLFQ